MYKHFAILGLKSSRAAEASECAAEQNKFWAYHDLVFEDQISTRSTLDQEHLASLAGDLELDTDTFGECMSSGKYSLQITRDFSSRAGAWGAGHTRLFDQRRVYLRSPTF